MAAPNSLSDLFAHGRDAARFDVAVLSRLIDMLGQLAVNLLVAALILAITVVAARWASKVTRQFLGPLRL